LKNRWQKTWNNITPRFPQRSVAPFHVNGHRKES
jgi:hypothetical protein